MRRYRHTDELNALLSPRVAVALRAACATRGGFSDVFGDARSNGAHDGSQNGAVLS
jgi:hypothetical protein